MTLALVVLRALLAYNAPHFDLPKAIESRTETASPNSLDSGGWDLHGGWVAAWAGDGCTSATMVCQPTGNSPHGPAPKRLPLITKPTPLPPAGVSRWELNPHREMRFAQLAVRSSGTLTIADHLPLPAGDGSNGSLHSGSVSPGTPFAHNGSSAWHGQVRSISAAVTPHGRVGELPHG